MENSSRTKFIVVHIIAQIVIVAIFFINQPDERYGGLYPIFYSLAFIVLCLIGYVIAYSTTPNAKATSKQVIKAIGKTTGIFWGAAIVFLLLILGPMREVLDKRQMAERNRINRLYGEKVYQHYRNLYALNKDYQFIWHESYDNKIGMVSPAGDTMVVNGFRRAKDNPELLICASVYNKHPIQDTSYWLAKGLEINKIFIQDSTYTSIKHIENIKIIHISPTDYIMSYQDECFEMRVTNQEKKVFITTKINKSCCKNCVLKPF